MLYKQIIQLNGKHFSVSVSCSVNNKRCKIITLGRYIAKRKQFTEKEKKQKKTLTN